MSTLSQVNLLAVWNALGGGSLRRGRGKAFWRSGDGFSVKLDARNGQWFDHVGGVGGGALQLVEHTLKMTRRDALAWLEDGGFIEPRNLSVEVKADHVKRRNDADELIENAIAWRDQRLFELEEEKHRANSNGNIGALANAAHLHCVIAEARGLRLLELYRIDQVNDPEGFAKTRAAVKAESALYRGLMIEAANPVAAAVAA